MYDLSRGTFPTTTLAAALLRPCAGVQDEELRVPAPPDAACLRIIAVAAPQPMHVGAIMFGPTEQAEILPHEIGAAGEVQPETAGERVTLEAGRSDTLWRAEDGAQPPVKDQLIENAARRGLMPCNLTGDAAVRHYVQSDRMDTITDPTPGGGRRTREINALTADLAVSAHGPGPSTYPETKLNRRAHVGFVVATGGDGPIALMAQDSLS